MQFMNEHGQRGQQVRQPDIENIFQKISVIKIPALLFAQ